jgi:glycosyltransferase involved in cell wall biosynthesis
MNLQPRPSVSVVIPTFNRRQMLSDAVASVLAQSYSDLEVIVVDDGSTDGTRDAIRDQYGMDARLRVVTQPNRERAIARNRGIHESRGEWIAFLDSDDLWSPDKLERQVAKLAETGADCCYCLFNVLNSSLETTADAVLPPHGDLFARLLHQCFIGSMTPLIRRSCFDAVGGFCEDRRLLCFEDWEMWTRLAGAFDWALVPEVLGSYRLHPGNTQHAADLEIDELRMDLMLRYPLSSADRIAVREYSTARRWHWATRLDRKNPYRVMQILTRLAVHDPGRLLYRNFWGLLARATSHSAFRLGRRVTAS